MNQLLGAPDIHPYAHWTAGLAARQLGEAGWDVVRQQEDFPFTRFFDVGAVVYYLKAVPWQIPDFSVEAYREPLWELHQRIAREGYVDVGNHRFLLITRNPRAH